MTGMGQSETALSWYKYSRLVFGESMHYPIEIQYMIQCMLSCHAYTLTRPRLSILLRSNARLANEADLRILQLVLRRDFPNLILLRSSVKNPFRSLQR
eukprot:4103372-Pleurochrysis_carterae.AAC.2